jgi:hypothetical protein
VKCERLWPGPKILGHGGEQSDRWDGRTGKETGDHDIQISGSSNNFLSCPRCVGHMFCGDFFHLTVNAVAVILPLTADIIENLSIPGPTLHSSIYKHV